MSDIFTKDYKVKVEDMIGRFKNMKDKNNELQEIIDNNKAPRRSPDITTVDIESLKVLAKYGVDRETAKILLGINHENGNDKAIKDIENAYKKGDAEGRAMIYATLFKRAESGDSKVMMYLGRARLGLVEKQKVEHSGAVTFDKIERVIISEQQNEGK